MTEEQITSKIADHLEDFAKALSIDPDSIDGQLLANAVVAIQNTYQGYENGEFVGVIEHGETEGSVLNGRL